MLKLNDWRTNARTSVELDLYFCAIRTAAFEWGFSEEKVLVFYQLLNGIHSRVAQQSLEELYQYYKEELLKRSFISTSIFSTKPPLSVEEAKKITDYITST